jgi:hypothetical protein
MKLRFGKNCSNRRDKRNKNSTFFGQKVTIFQFGMEVEPVTGGTFEPPIGEGTSIFPKADAGGRVVKCKRESRRRRLTQKIGVLNGSGWLDCS